jgi:formylmethanofuran dehydrogenase subunit C
VSVVATLKERLETPLEVEGFSPDVLCSLTNAEILALPVHSGNKQRRLGDFFEVEGEKSTSLDLHGDLALVKWIGKGMTQGSITVHGNAGMHLGSAMRGGAIFVDGNAADWLGAEMTGGLIHVAGTAGGQVGAAYRGSTAGMRGGEILIHGDAGIEVGMRMLRGLITVRGRVGDFAGLQMKGGTLFLIGGAGIRSGAWMARGTIVSHRPLNLLPTFLYACTYEPTFLRVYASHLESRGVAAAELGMGGSYRRFTGDTCWLGKGEILVREEAVAD